MTDEREFYAATVQEAVQKAADELGLTPEELPYRVLDEGNSGFLGIGARDARVTVETSGDKTTPPAVEPQETTPSDALDSSEPESPEETTDSSTLSEIYGESEDVEEDPEELLDEVRVLVTSILEAMDFEARVEVYDAGGFIAADVAPDNTGLFIGQKGETIDALQYLVNVAAFRDRPFFKRVVLEAWPIELPAGPSASVGPWRCLL